MRLLLLRDKKPGHFHQVEGIAMALDRAVGAEVRRIDIRPKWFAHDDVRKFCLRRYGRANPAVWLERLYGITPDDVGQPDVVLTSGRPTIGAGIYIARMTGAKLVYAGRATGYPYDDFTLMLIPFPRNDGEFRQVYGPIPCAIDPDRLPKPPELASAADLAGRRLSLFIGGDSFTHTYSEAEWQAIGDLVVATSARYGVRWNVSTSRRTQEAVVDRFAAMKSRGEIDIFIDYRVKGSGSAEELFSADAIVITEDSQTMIAEGLAAGRRVVALKPADAKKSLNDETVSALIGEGSLAVVPIATMTPERFVSKLTGLRTPDKDPRDEIARIVLDAVRG